MVFFTQGTLTLVATNSFNAFDLGKISELVSFRFWVSSYTACLYFWSFFVEDFSSRMGLALISITGLSIKDVFPRTFETLLTPIRCSLPTPPNPTYSTTVLHQSEMAFLKSHTCRLGVWEVFRCCSILVLYSCFWKRLTQQGWKLKHILGPNLYYFTSSGNIKYL